VLPGPRSASCWLLLLLLLCRLRERDEAKTSKMAAAGGWKESGKDKRRREAAAALEGALNRHHHVIGIENAVNAWDAYAVSPPPTLCWWFIVFRRHVPSDASEGT
jgi:hypothetical protein